MNWTKKQSSFRYAGTPVTRTTITANTPLGEFKVFEAIGGRVFMQHPFMRGYNDVGFPGFKADPNFEIMPADRIPVKDLKDGKNKCETVWSQVKSKINQF